MKSTYPDGISLFKETGFFEEKEAAIKHLRDVDEILFTEGVDYCIMFGTLLGAYRHDDLIPWDDDLDIIVFDTDKFEKKCQSLFEERGYIVPQDVRIVEGGERRCGFRIHAEQGLPVTGQSLTFPWVGVWEPDTKNNLMTLPPEEFSYSLEDFFPLQRRAFLDFSVSVPKCSEKILKQYYGDDCMEVCVLHDLDHRHFKSTGYPSTKFPLKDVLAYLKENP